MFTTVEYRPEIACCRLFCSVAYLSRGYPKDYQEESSRVEYELSEQGKSFLAKSNL
jgi:hypothetical protein